MPSGERAPGFPQVAGTPGQVGGRWKSPTWPLPRAGKGVPRAMPTPALPQGRAGQTRPHLSASTLAGSLYSHHSCHLWAAGQTPDGTHQVGNWCRRWGRRADAPGPWPEAVGGAKARAPSLTHDLQELKGLLCAKCLLRAWCVMALCDPVRCRSRPALQQSAGLWVGRAPVSFMRLRRDTGLGDDASGDQGESGASALDRNHIGWRSPAGDRKRGPDIPGSPLQGHHLTDL